MQKNSIVNVLNRPDFNPRVSSSCLKSINSAEKYANTRQQFWNNLKAIDKELAQFATGGLETTFGIMLLPETLAAIPGSGGTAAIAAVGEIGLVGVGLTNMGASITDMVTTAVDIVKTDIPAIQNAQRQANGFGRYLEAIGYPNYHYGR